MDAPLRADSIYGEVSANLAGLVLRTIHIHVQIAGLEALVLRVAQLHCKIDDHLSTDQVTFVINLSHQSTSVKLCR